MGVLLLAKPRPCGSNILLLLLQLLTGVVNVMVLTVPLPRPMLLLLLLMLPLLLSVVVVVELMLQMLLLLLMMLLLFRMLLLFVMMLLLPLPLPLLMLLMDSCFLVLRRTAGLRRGLTAAVVAAVVLVVQAVLVVATVGDVSVMLAAIGVGCNVTLPIVWVCDPRLKLIVGAGVVAWMLVHIFAPAAAAAAAAAACWARCCCACIRISSAVGRRGVDSVYGGNVVPLATPAAAAAAAAPASLGSILMRIFGISVASLTGAGAGIVSVKGRPSLPFWLGMEIMISLELPLVAPANPLLNGSNGC